MRTFLMKFCLWNTTRKESMTPRGIGIAIMLFAVLPLDAGVIASSNWENAADGVDGWSFTEDGTNLVRVATGGNPGGFLQVTDLGLGGVIFFNAPAKFLSDRTAAYGGTLAFDEQQSIGDRQTVSDIPEVLLIGNGVTLTFDTPNSNNPAVTPNWSSYSVRLLASAGWIDDDTGLAATETQMQSALANVTALQIRAEYSSTLDVDGLDNVVLASVPEPASAELVLCAVPLVFLWRRINRR